MFKVDFGQKDYVEQQSNLTFLVADLVIASI